MRKSIYSIFILSAAAWTLSSCSSDNDSEYVEKPEALNPEHVEINLAVQVADVMASRSQGDASMINELYYLVMDKDGNPADYPQENSNGDVEVLPSKLVRIEDYDPSSEYQLTLYMIRGQEFNISFWAQCDEASDIFDLSSFPEVNIDYSKAQNNNENFDAFCATLNVKGDVGVFNDKVTLRRPFAQINMGAILDDWKASGIYDIQTVKSSLEIPNAANCINVLTDRVSVNGVEGVTSNPVVIPLSNIFPDEDENSTLIVEEFEEPFNESRCISSSYFLVNANDLADSENTSMPFVFNLDDGKRTHTISVNNVPVKRNYRTNIVGSILTTTNKIFVVINKDFSGEYDENADDTEELEWNYEVSDNE